MKRSEKELPNKANFSNFLLLNCSNFRLKLFETLLSYKIVKENKFEEVWAELEVKIVFRDNHSQNI